MRAWGVLLGRARWLAMAKVTVVSYQIRQRRMYLWNDIKTKLAESHDYQLRAYAHFAGLIEQGHSSVLFTQQLSKLTLL